MFFDTGMRAAILANRFTLKWRVAGHSIKMAADSPSGRIRRLPQLPPSPSLRAKEGLPEYDLPAVVPATPTIVIGFDVNGQATDTVQPDNVQLRIKGRGSFLRSEKRHSALSDTSKLETLLAKQQQLEVEVQSAHTTVSSDAHSLKDQLYARNEDLRRENQDLRETLQLLKKQTTEEIAMRTVAEREAAKLIEQIFADHDTDEVVVTPSMVTNLASSLRSVMIQLDQAHWEMKALQGARDEAEARVLELLNASNHTPVTAYEELKDWQEKRVDEMKKTIAILKRGLDERNEELSELQGANTKLHQQLRQYTDATVTTKAS